jgi:Protein of unknown function (DUF3754)
MLRFLRWLCFIRCAVFCFIVSNPGTRNNHRGSGFPFLHESHDDEYGDYDTFLRESQVSFNSSICRVVASSDRKLPTLDASFPKVFTRNPLTLKKLDIIYHALAYEQTRNLSYLNTVQSLDVEEDRRLLNLLKSSLEDAGFQRLSQRDLDLCKALNTGYLFRLSIKPDILDLDPCFSSQMYPENGLNKTMDLFDGRMLIYRRGYSSEITKGRLLLPKLDYIQASLVQESAFIVTQKLGKLERSITRVLLRILWSCEIRFREFSNVIMANLIPKKLQILAREKLGWNQGEVSNFKKGIRRAKQKDKTLFKLGRYGASTVRFVDAPYNVGALSPFLVCVVDDSGGNGVENDANINSTEGFSASLNHGNYICEYDDENSTRCKKPSSAILLERISIGDVVNIFSPISRKKMFRNFLSKVELVEPAFEEVVVVWRPPQKKRNTSIKDRLPKVLYHIAEIFDMEELLPANTVSEEYPKPPAIEIRAFTQVPMANLLAVLPKTRLVLRPADAFLFDFISVLTFILVLSSQRFDNPKLDLAAIVSVSLWIFRTIIRYSNKLARYDLLVKKFLTSKIEHRNGGAVEYIGNEAASQRAIRATFLYTWLINHQNSSMTYQQILEEACIGVNDMIESDHFVDVPVAGALEDLRALNLITYSSNNTDVVHVANVTSSDEALKSIWNNLFEKVIDVRHLNKVNL